MSSIEAYYLRNKKTGEATEKRYMVRYRTPDRRSSKKRGFRTKRDAQDWLADNIVKMNSGTWRAASAGAITVSALADEWLQGKVGVTPKTRAAYEGAVKHIKETGRIGSTYVKDVDQAAVERWVAELREGRAPKTVHNVFAVLNQILARAVRDKRTPENPCAYVELPRIPKKHITIVPPAGVEAMAQAAGENGDLIRFLAYTGLRWGEFAGLQVQDVDLERHRLRIRHTIVEVRGKLVYGEPKHGKQRLVPLFPRAEEILREYIEGKEPGALVFETANGGPWRVGKARRGWFDSAAKAAGYPALTPHGLRHSYASAAIAAGASIKALQRALGHATAAFTLDVYADLFPDDFGSFTAKMDTLFSQDCAQKVPTGEGKGG